MKGFALFAAVVIVVVLAQVSRLIIFIPCVHLSQIVFTVYRLHMFCLIIGLSVTCEAL